LTGGVVAFLRRSFNRWLNSSIAIAASLLEGVDREMID
jgi:hypothetical protein